MAKRFTEEDILNDIAAGMRKVEDLAAKYSLTTASMKNALNKLNIQLPSAPVVKTASAAAFGIESDWKALYDEYDHVGAGCQAHFIIAECRLNNGMSAAETRAFMKEHFKFVTYNSHAPSARQRSLI